MDDNSNAIRPDELDGLFARFAAFSPCALAVSGGSDSTALMVLFADWMRAKGQDPGAHTVVSVDHGLRPESRNETRQVHELALSLGYRSETLLILWDEEKPRTGIQAAAREKRYQLFGSYMRQRNIPLLLTAHTQDDQAETLLMRLARGSGLDGLSAMAPISPLGDNGPGARDVGVSATRWIGRPLLDVPKARLRATLQQRGVGWIEDPSNAAPEFERTRLRAARSHLDALGLTPAMLALSAARLARARQAIEALVDRLCEPRTGLVQADACGVIRVDRARLAEAGEEVALRVLDRAIAAAGGAAEAVPLRKLEAVLGAVCGGDAPPAVRLTLARAVITAERSTVHIEREPGREPLPELTLAPGAAALWDGRYWVRVSPSFAGSSVLVRALGETNLRDLRRQGLVAESARVATVPSFWHEGGLIAVPPLRYWSSPSAGESLGAAFVGIRDGIKKA